MQSETKKLLLADDDEAIVDATTIMLEMMGYEVMQTLDGSKVIDIVKNSPDLILLDIWMSGIDGRDVCKELKSNPETKDIPVLMISASRDIRQSALEAGANDFLEKPFEMNDLLAKVETLLKTE